MSGSSSTTRTLGATALCTGTVMVPDIVVLDVMTLGAQHGDTVEVADDDASAVDAVAALVTQDLDAD
jgi:PTS HPr component phosphorylation site